MSPAGTHLFQAVGPLLRTRPRYAPPPRCAARATSPPGSGGGDATLEPAPSPACRSHPARDRRPPTSSEGIAGMASVRGRRNTCGCAPCASANGRLVVVRPRRPPCPARCGGGIVRIPASSRPSRSGGRPSSTEVRTRVERRCPLGADVGLVLVSSPMSRRGDGRVWHSTSPVDDGTAGSSDPRRGASADQRATCWPSSDARRSGGDRAQPDGPDPAREPWHARRGSRPSPAAPRRHPDRLRPLME